VKAIRESSLGESEKRECIESMIAAPYRTDVYIRAFLDARLLTPPSAFVDTTSPNAVVVKPAPRYKRPKSKPGRKRKRRFKSKGEGPGGNTASPRKKTTRQRLVAAHASSTNESLVTDLLGDDDTETSAKALPKARTCGKCGAVGHSANKCVKEWLDNHCAPSDQLDGPYVVVRARGNDHLLVDSADLELAKLAQFVGIPVEISGKEEPVSASEDEMDCKPAATHWSAAPARSEHTGVDESEENQHQSATASSSTAVPVVSKEQAGVDESQRKRAATRSSETTARKEQAGVDESEEMVRKPAATRLSATLTRKEQAEDDAATHQPDESFAASFADPEGASPIASVGSARSMSVTSFASRDLPDSDEHMEMAVLDRSLNDRFLHMDPAQVEQHPVSEDEDESQEVQCVLQRKPPDIRTFPIPWGVNAAPGMDGQCGLTSTCCIDSFLAIFSINRENNLFYNTKDLRDLVGRTALCKALDHIHDGNPDLARREFGYFLFPDREGWNGGSTAAVDLWTGPGEFLDRVSSCTPFRCGATTYHGTMHSVCTSPECPKKSQPWRVNWTPRHVLESLYIPQSLEEYVNRYLQGVEFQSEDECRQALCKAKVLKRFVLNPPGQQPRLLGVLVRQKDTSKSFIDFPLELEVMGKPASIRGFMLYNGAHYQSVTPFRNHGYVRFEGMSPSVLTKGHRLGREYEFLSHKQAELVACDKNWWVTYIVLEISPSARQTELEPSEPMELEPGEPTEEPPDKTTELEPAESTELELAKPTEEPPDKPTELEPAEPTELEPSDSTEQEPDKQTEVELGEQTELEKVMPTEADLDEQMQLEPVVPTEADSDDQTELEPGEQMELEQGKQMELELVVPTEADAGKQTEGETVMPTEAQLGKQTVAEMVVPMEEEPGKQTEVEPGEQTGEKGVTWKFSICTEVFTKRKCADCGKYVMPRSKTKPAMAALMVETEEKKTKWIHLEAGQSIDCIGTFFASADKECLEQFCIAQFAESSVSARIKRAQKSLAGLAKGTT
jgi:hypothetical protein